MPCQLIRKSLLLLLVCALPTVATAAQQPAQPQPTPVAPKTHLKVGQQAPEFTLMDTEGKEVKLSDFIGKRNVVLAFYILAFTGG
jgi:cytochrome oxidase Cu insertion factor (SCO1/SenC/PrrC family)